MDLITYYGWTKIIYIYSDFDGLLRLQRIFKNIPRNPMGQPRFHIEIARKITTVNEAIEFLLTLEKQNRDSVKHIGNQGTQVLVCKSRNLITKFLLSQYSPGLQCSAG